MKFLAALLVAVTLGFLATQIDWGTSGFGTSTTAKLDAPAAEPKARAGGDVGIPFYRHEYVMAPGSTRELEFAVRLKGKRIAENYPKRPPANDDFTVNGKLDYWEAAGAKREVLSTELMRSDPPAVKGMTPPPGYHLVMRFRIAMPDSTARSRGTGTWFKVKDKAGETYAKFELSYTFGETADMMYHVTGPDLRPKD